MGQPHLRDLFRDDLGDIDFGDFQKILITLIAISGSVSLPDIDTVLLSSFGLGQGAYLVKKMALPFGQG